MVLPSLAEPIHHVDYSHKTPSAASSPYSQTRAHVYVYDGRHMVPLIAMSSVDLYNLIHYVHLGEKKQIGLDNWTEMNTHPHEHGIHSICLDPYPFSHIT